MITLLALIIIGALAMMLIGIIAMAFMIIVPIAVGLFVIAIVCRLISEIIRKRSISKLLNGGMISSRDFMKNRKEFGKTDTSGCYVICSYGYGPVQDFSNYHDAYVGQSIHMFQRVRDHFTGHGNENVYLDVMRGESVYVKFVPCEPFELNYLEKKLISEFDSKNSGYNKTAGGSATRY